MRAMPPVITDEATREAACLAAERTFRKLVRKLIRQHAMFAEIGENDMGLLHKQYAGRFHTITQKLHCLVSDLTHDIVWPGPRID